MNDADSRLKDYIDMTEKVKAAPDLIEKVMASAREHRQAERGDAVRNRKATTTTSTLLGDPTDSA